ncbi:MAG: chalcone isomerase [Aquificaceae bacterium]|nr:MAG: chalcone isomerase [Aquificaceae bacterium]
MMNRFKSFMLSLCLLFSVNSSYAYTAGGVVLPDKMSVGGKLLVLNGAGLRTKFILTLYAGGLYLGAKNADANKIINANEPMAIRLKIISGFITAEKMSTATKEGFHNSTGGKTAPVQAQIDQFMGVFKQKIEKGDEFDFIYTPTGGTKIVKNNKAQTVIKSLAFKKALFGIWLSNRPAQASLKKEMLGEKIDNSIF